MLSSSREELCKPVVPNWWLILSWLQAFRSTSSKTKLFWNVASFLLFWSTWCQLYGSCNLCFACPLTVVVSPDTEQICSTTCWIQVTAYIQLDFTNAEHKKELENILCTDAVKDWPGLKTTFPHLIIFKHCSCCISLFFVSGLFTVSFSSRT